MSSPLRLVARLLAGLGLLMSLIGLGRLWLRHAEIAEYRRAGQHLTGTVLAADVSYSREGTAGPGRNNYRRFDYVNFATTLAGQPLHTPLDHTEDLIDHLRPGQPLEVVYLPANKWTTPDGRVGFFDDHRPVPLSYLMRSPFATPYAYLVYGFVLGTALLLWLGWRR